MMHLYSSETDGFVLDFFEMYNYLKIECGKMARTA